MPSLCSSPPETPRRPFPSGTCAGFGWRGGHLGSRCGSRQVAEKHSRCAGPPEPSAPAKTKRPQRALVLPWRSCATHSRCSGGACSQTRREDTGSSTSTLSLKRWISKSPGCENNKSTQQALQALVESSPSPLLYVLDPMEERALGQQIKANNNYYQINAV